MACELYQTLCGVGAYTESENALRGREIWPHKTIGHSINHYMNFETHVTDDFTPECNIYIPLICTISMINLVQRQVAIYV